jgi:hypothetical protein
MRRLGDDFKIYTDIVAESLRKKFESGMPHIRAVRELNRYSQKINNKLKRKYRYINSDFREHFGGLFDFFGTCIDTLVHDFENRHNAPRQDAGR